MTSVAQPQQRVSTSFKCKNKKIGYFHSTLRYKLGMDKNEICGDGHNFCPNVLRILSRQRTPTTRGNANTMKNPVCYLLPLVVFCGFCTFNILPVTVTFKSHWRIQQPQMQLYICLLWSRDNSTRTPHWHADELMTTLSAQMVYSAGQHFWNTQIITGTTKMQSFERTLRNHQGFHSFVGYCFVFESASWAKIRSLANPRTNCGRDWRIAWVKTKFNYRCRRRNSDILLCF